MNAREKFAERYWPARVTALEVLELAMLGDPEVTKEMVRAAQIVMTLDGPPAPPVEPPATTESRLEAALRAVLDGP